MDDSTNTFHTISDATYVNIKCKRKTRGATMYNNVKKANESGICYPITIDLRTDMAYDEHVEDFMG